MDVIVQLAGALFKYNERRPQHLHDAKIKIDCTSFSMYLSRTKYLHLLYVSAYSVGRQYFSPNLFSGRLLEVPASGKGNCLRPSWDFVMYLADFQNANSIRFPSTWSAFLENKFPKLKNGGSRGKNHDYCMAGGGVFIGRVLKFWSGETDLFPHYRSHSAWLLLGWMTVHWTIGWGFRSRVNDIIIV